MLFFLDSADINEIKEAHDSGLLDGVTTNPSLCAKTDIKRSFEDHIAQICDITEGDVSAEVTATTYQEMLSQAREIAKIRKNVVVKIPLIPEGIRVIKTLSQENIPTNCTLCFSATQALIAAKVGAKYISPFIGRLDDHSTNGTHLLNDIIDIYDIYNYETLVLAASIRHPIHVLEAAQCGADAATMPFSIMKSLFKHPLTDIGLKRFMDDWKKNNMEDRFEGYKKQ